MSGEKYRPTLGSLFDGIGGFPLAAQRHGITPLWASEIEKFPMEVTKAHLPAMRHLGDIAALKGATLPPVDVITGGSPCQDLVRPYRRMKKALIARSQAHFTMPARRPPYL